MNPYERIEMLTVYSLMPILIPTLVANIIILTNQNRKPNDDQLETWDNNLTW